MPDDTKLESPRIPDQKPLSTTDKKLVLVGAAAAPFFLSGATSELIKHLPLEHIQEFNLLGILRNQGTDLATPNLFALGFCVSAILYGEIASQIKFIQDSPEDSKSKRFIKRFAKKYFFSEEAAIRTTALLGMAIGLLYTLDEYAQYLHPIMKPTYSFTGSMTKGDPADMLVYATPIIAGGIYLVYDLVRSLRSNRITS